MIIRVPRRDFCPILLICLVSAALTFFLAGCESNVIYEKNVRIPANSWSRHNIPVFKAEIDDTLSGHDLMINIRNTGEYPLSNLFLFISAKSPSGAAVRDTVEFVLADPSGRWLGRGFGSIWQNRFYYRQNVRFAETGVFTFEIEQAMRLEDLPGITDVGLRIEKNIE